MLWSRAAYEAAGGWDPDVRINQDGDLVMRALAAGVPLIRARGGLGYYRRLPDGGISLSGKGRTPRGLEGRIDVLEKLERRLRGTGRLERHAAPLAEAFGEVARDAARTGAAEAGARARQGIARTGGAAWFGTARRAVGRRIGAMMPQDRPAGIVRRGVPRPAPGPVAAGEDPLVSVILPTYNRRVTLRRAIDSVLAQTWRNLELIVVDDGSEDGTDDLVRSVRDSRLRVLRQACNEGVATARNRGLAEAKGGLIAFLDSDDEWRPEKLERQVARMRAAPSRVGLLYTGLLVRQPGGVVETWTPEARGMVLAEILRRNVVHFGTSSVMIRAEAAEAVGGFDPTLPANEDHDYWARIARLYEFDFDPEPLAIYDQAGGEPSAEGKRSARFGRNMQARDRFVQEHGFEADRLGATFAYQMDSARRHLEWDEGSARTGRRLLLKAARAAPGRRLPWVWMALSALPKRSRALAVSRLRGVRRRPEPRRHRRAAPHDT
jgi:glycosyltransferase involved in cell wall biosynthesis